jgi:phosphate:Na+ symporter
MSCKRTQYIGQVILGFGLLFQGLHTMSGAMAPLKDSVMFQNFILNATNPFVGFLIGVVLCAIIQSSSAAVGILQALAMQGLMPLVFAGYIVCGINVGSSTPTLISALNAKNNAKRAALIYLIFNVVGALIFVPLTMITPLCQFITDNVASPAFQVSVYHILFKIVTGLILLPLTNLIVKLTYKVLPKQAHENVFRFEFIDKNMVGDTHVLALQVKKEVLRVCKLVRENIETACQSLLDHDISKSKTVYENEEVIDYLTGEITDYLTKNVNTLEMPQEVSDFLSNMFLMINELEQIGDHADKIMSVNERCIEDNLQYSDEAKKEFEIIYKEDLFLYDEVVQGFETGKQTVTREQIRESEHAIAKLSYEAQAHHMDRLKEGICEFDTGLAFTESLNSLSRIANHITAMVEA